MKIEGGPCRLKVLAGEGRNQMQTVLLKLKGLRYYFAESLSKSGHLKPGTPVLLEAEPCNPHDSNAVAVYDQHTRLKLGHVSASVARKFQILLAQKAIDHACIEAISKKENLNAITLKIRYDLDQSKKYIPIDFENLPTSPGVYSIKNVKSQRIYIGSTLNIRSRISKHSHDLFFEIHANKHLQDDYKKGERSFEARVLSHHTSIHDLENSEIAWIRKYLVNGENLYNTTIDGQGRAERQIYKQNLEARSVSERNWRTEIPIVGEKENTGSAQRSEVHEYETIGCSEREPEFIKSSFEDTKHLFDGFITKENFMRAILDRTVSLNTLRKLNRSTELALLSVNELEFFRQALRSLELREERSESRPDIPIKFNKPDSESKHPRNSLHELPLNKQKPDARSAQVIIDDERIKVHTLRHLRNLLVDQQVQSERDEQARIAREQKQKDSVPEINCDHPKTVRGGKRLIDMLKLEAALPFGARTVDGLMVMVNNRGLSLRELCLVAEKAKSLKLREADLNTLIRAIHENTLINAINKNTS